MAVQDDDWKKFLDSTEEDPDEVETPDEEEDEQDGTDEEEKGKKPNKSEEDEEEDPDNPDEEDPDKGDDDEEEGDEGDEDPDADDYKPRLKQFLTKDGKLDAKKIEDAYVASGKEAVELNKRLKDSSENYNNLLSAIKANPKAAELLFGKDGAEKLANDSSIPTTGGGKSDDQQAQSHPLLQHLDAQIKNQQKKEYNEFVDAHPEAVTDPQKARLIGEFLEGHGAIYRKQHDGEIASMKESLEAAYRYYGWDLEIEKKESVASRAKKSAATRTTPQGKKKATKKEASKGEQFFAQKLGVKLKS